MSTFEDEYMPVLMGIETAITPTYHDHDEMSDWEAENAINGLIRTYTAEMRRRNSPDLNLDELETEVYERVQAICDFYLGREELESEDGETIQLDGDETYSVSEIVKCLKRIRKSIQLWRKQGGHRGYFNFVSEYLPPSVPISDED